MILIIVSKNCINWKKEKKNKPRDSRFVTRTNCVHARIESYKISIKDIDKVAIYAE